MLMNTLNDLRDQAYANAKSKGFHDAPKSVGDDVALILTELGEAYEDFRSGHAPNKVWYEDPSTGEKTSEALHTSSVTGLLILHKPCGVPSEMADVIVRILDFSGKHGIDIEKAVLEKMAFNRTRPHKHGKVL
jgi:NTP pyrophosphatase (non-canonical NTP hydrolase)